VELDKLHDATFDLQFNICECANPIEPCESATAASAVQTHDHRLQSSVNMNKATGSAIWILCLVFWLAGKNFQAVWLYKEPIKVRAHNS